MLVTLPVSRSLVGTGLQHLEQHLPKFVRSAIPTTQQEQTALKHTLTQLPALPSVITLIQTARTALDATSIIKVLPVLPVCATHVMVTHPLLVRSLNLTGTMSRHQRTETA